jgi:hypothetical protein
MARDRLTRHPDGVREGLMSNAHSTQLDVRGAHFAAGSCPPPVAGKEG